MKKTFYISVILPLKLDWEALYYVEAEELTLGQRVKLSFASRVYIAIISNIYTERPVTKFKILPVIELLDTDDIISVQQLKLWRFLSEYYMCTIGEVYKCAYPSHKNRAEQQYKRKQQRISEKRKKDIDKLSLQISRLQVRQQKKQNNIDSVKSLSKKSILIAQNNKISQEIESKKLILQSMYDDFQNNTLDLSHYDIHLSESQARAEQEILEHFDKSDICLLNGVTGSGKTEIYSSLAHRYLSKSQNVLYLVPEILLTNQLESRLLRIFPSQLLTYHSQKSESYRQEVIYKMKNSNYVLLGTRSSIFLPFNNLGLIIVDEEHDSSYKQEQIKPYYNARDVAVYLSKIYSANIVLASASPSLESLYNVSVGKYMQVNLSTPYYKVAPTYIELIDIKKERKKNAMRGLFSLRLIDAINECIKEGHQVLLLKDRRGYSPMLQCSNCSYIVRCPNCHVNLRYHKDSNKLLCHYCGYKAEYSPVCPQCSQSAIDTLGAGTQKLEEQAKVIFPQAKIARMDSDTTVLSQQLKDNLQAFERGDIDILLGTQMLTKGLDFPNLRLLAVIQADSLLAQDDFRADERALQLLEQFKGRGARRGGESHFIIQSLNISHPIYQQVLGLRNGMLYDLLKERRLFNYPPYTRMIKLIVKDADKDRLCYMANQLSLSISDKLSSFAANSIIVPAYSPLIDKIAGEYIMNIRVTLERNSFLHKNKAYLQHLVSSFERKYKYSAHIFIDVDPM